MRIQRLALSLCCNLLLASLLVNCGKDVDNPSELQETGARVSITNHLSGWLKTGPYQPPYFQIPKSEGCVMLLEAGTQLDLLEPASTYDDGVHTHVKLRNPAQQGDCRISTGYIQSSDWNLTDSKQPSQASVVAPTRTNPTIAPSSPTALAESLYPQILHPNARPVLVLMYHEIVAGEPQYNDDVTTDNFRAQLRYLRSQGYESISMQQLYDHLADGRSLPRKPYLITFDDGYIGNYRHAFPILRDLGEKASFFVHTRYVGAPGAHDHMTWENLRRLDRHRNFTVHSHTLNHPNLTELAPEKLSEELRDSLAVIERQLGRRQVKAIAYPYGAYSSEVIDATNLHYELGFSVGRGSLAPNLYNIPRMGVGRRLDSLDKFIQALEVWTRANL